jgi:hypothetical protein
MFSILLDHTSIAKNKKLKETLIRGAFFVFQGLLASILLNDSLRILYGDFDSKPLVEYGVATLVTISPYISPRFHLMGRAQNNYAMGIGMTIGTWLANQSENKAIKL